MKYTLSVESSAGREQPVAQEDLANLAAALEWASTLLAAGDDDTDHFLRSADGCVNARYVKTAGRHWYAIALPATAGRPVLHETVEAEHTDRMPRMPG